MDLSSFVIDLNVCLVEFKGDLDIRLYDVYCFPNDTEHLGKCIAKLNDRAIKEFGRELLPEEVDLLTLIMFNSQRYPAIMLASLIDQVFYWRGMDPEKIEHYTNEAFEGEDDGND